MTNISIKGGKVSAKQLHQHLGITSDLHAWLASVIKKLALTEGDDYVYANNRRDAELSGHTAKHVIMTTFTPVAKEIREKFIAYEAAYTGELSGIFEKAGHPALVLLTMRELAAATGTTYQGIQNRLTLRGLRVRNSDGGHDITDAGQRYFKFGKWRASVADEVLGLPLSL